MQQFYGMFVKKFIQTRRNFAVTTAQVLLPVFFTIWVLAATKQYDGHEHDEPAFTLNLALFKDNIVTYSDGITPTATTTGMTNAYKDQFSGCKEKVNRTTYAEMDSYYKVKQCKSGIFKFNRSVNNLIASPEIKWLTGKKSSGFFQSVTFPRIYCAFKLTFITNRSW